VSVNTTSAHRRPVFVDCHSRRLGIDRQCITSLHRNDMAYCHFGLCRDCELGCFSVLLLADIWRLSVVAVVFLYQITVFYNKTQHHHFWNFILILFQWLNANCGGGGSQQREVADGADVVFTDTASRMLSIEGMRWCGFRKQYWISWKPLLLWLLTLDLDNFRFI